MKEKSVLWLLLLIVSVTSAQIKGTVVDEFNKPISYVNIWVEKENNSTTSEENGEFSINCLPNKNLIFSALGYEIKTVKASEAEKVILKINAFELKEVVIAKRFETREIEIGKVKNETYQAFENGPRIDAKFFPYLPKYKRTRYIQKVNFFTDSQLESVSFKIHFYEVKTDGSPGDELLNKDFLVSVKKGVKKTFFDVTDFNLKMPKKGIFVGFEKLIIERNKLEKEVMDSNTGKTTLQKTYFPFVLYNFVEREFIYTFSGGKWNKQTKQDVANPSNKMTVYEPAINLILTN
ncbi:carboxypeptidase-like regulatory domain-containing protein [Flavobacterium paronense]|uniref:Carboxypeptidase-like regulatory domain-containing protein n=1 Tax=Flavobacterium paronense TaxID=1392775 RepID=A0ABV5GER1_9FLAO|nr:carboxypeptidase-like regulatory domain-containing protein [Flavobacterium paronense]MDN3678441.1 carboxypeptidase-like regulatory domain-containing protein [Flavobacterium paronense]